MVSRLLNNFVCNLVFSLYPVYVIRALTLLDTKLFIHLFIRVSIMVPYAPVNSNIRECIFLSLLMFYRGVSVCVVTNVLFFSYQSFV